MFSLPKIYPITDRRLSGLTHIEQCRRLIEGGAELIQIREKQAMSDEFYAAAGEVLELARKSNVKILVNDRVDIALAAGAAGVHLGQDDLPPAAARRVLGSEAIIGFSTHSPAQATAAVGLPVDYIAIGPVYATTTKQNPDAVVGLAGVREVRQAIGDFPLVAIGGITRRNFQAVLDAGVDSVAIISDLLRDPAKISQSFRELNGQYPKR